jgi:hypothetical protein
MASTEVPEQFLILVIAHVTSPNDGRIIHVWFVMDPVVVHIVMGTVPDDDKVLTGNLTQLRYHCWVVQVSTRPMWFQWGVNDNSHNAENDHGHRNHRHTAC